MDDAVRIRRKDTTKGPPLRILCLDGGGVRGYSMLIILQELMHRTFVEMEGRAPKRHEIPKPCDHFDLIAGTGTGGLIAIMLGRLRLDLDTCKEVYVRMTRRVFETDKTFLGMPYKGTMFKASKLEEAIREVAREHTVFEDEGNDTLANATPMSPIPQVSASTVPQRTMSQSSRYSQIGMSPMNNRGSLGFHARGNPNALLYDTRDNRTKTAVTAVLKGTNVTTLLRSYDSRKEPAPDVNCAIWQAGRATAATQMAFKPIQVGQSIYLDEGAGKYNPSPQILDEAVQNEYPGRDVGMFISIGTGKRPSGTGARSHEWWEEIMGGSMGDFAEARRKLIGKLEGCEKSHQFMLDERLAQRGVGLENYVRLNVEVGVGEFGMNEWSRLSEISTNTRSYLSRSDVQNMSLNAAAKLAKIHFAKIRHDRAEARKQGGAETQRHGNRGDHQQNPWERPLPTVPPPQNFAVELPGDEGFRPGQHYYPHDPSYYLHRPSIADQKYTVSGDGYDQPPPAQPAHHQHTSSSQYNSSPHQDPARPSSMDYQNSARFSQNSYATDGSPRASQDFQQQQPLPPPLSSPPPIPPKTPVNGNAGLPYPDTQAPPDVGQWTFTNMGELGKRLPDVEGPPPPVNMRNKPQIPQ